MVSYIGYKSTAICLHDLSDSTNIVQLTPNAVQLKEVIVLPLSPDQYIKRGVTNISRNCPEKPFQAIAYYREKLTENNQFLKGEEAVFKSYFPNFQDTVKNQNQILLHRKNRNIKELAFMKKKRQKMYKKELKKAKKNNDTSKVIMEGTNLEKLFGGPNMIFSMDVNKLPYSFLDSNHYKDYNYQFGPTTTYQDKELIVIHFSTKRKVNHIKSNGTIWLDANSYAFVSIDYSGEFVIPFYARPILFAMGLKIEDPMVDGSCLYEDFEGKWYPKNFNWNITAKLTKRHLFSSNEHASFEIGQVYIVNAIETTGIEPIPKKKRFDSSKKMEDQVHPDANIRWENGNWLAN